MPFKTLRFSFVFAFLALLLVTAPKRALSLSSAPQVSAPQASTDDPATPLLKQGGDALAERKYADAEKAYKKASEIRRNCNECLLGLAMAQYKLGETDQAVKTCDRAIACAGDNTEGEAAHSLKGDALQSAAPDAKKLKSAEAEFRTAMQLEPHLPMTHLNLGVVLLEESQEAEGIAELNNFLLLNPNGENARYVSKLILDPKAAGDSLAPSLNVRTLTGEQFSLDGISAKVVVMDFWATWCEPCVESVPEIKQLTKKYSPSDLALISVSADRGEQPWKDFIAKKGMDWPQYWDTDGRIRKSFGVYAFPTYLVIDQQGFIRERIVGLNPQQSVVSRLKDTLKAMLSE
jgi:thiol-disulfide isomerase/thioredoxin